MKAETTKRLFKAIINSGLSRDVLQICERIIADERKIGHVHLADQLAKILEQANLNFEETKKASSGEHFSNLTTISNKSNLSELPRSRRSNELLATKIPFHNLRHHMVLPESVERRFNAIEKEFAARERLANHGLKYKKKILLYGSPGCGKTLGAERLAFNTGLPLIKVRFDAIMSSYFGDSATNLRAIFDSASISPCVLLLDECDFIAKARDVRNDVGEAPRIVNMLLTLLDEYDAAGLLVATTNIEKDLDKALFRRFDDVIEVSPPGKAEIIKLLKTSVSTLKVSSRVSWEKIAGEMVGSSAATVVKVSCEAAKSSILNGKTSITFEDFMRASQEIYKN